MVVVFKRVFKWILISMILQLVVLVYFNYIYIPGIGGGVQAKLNNSNGNTPSATAQNVLKTTKVNIPTNAIQIKISHDNLYGGYITDGKLNLVNIATGKVLKVFEQANKKVSFYKWLPDRNLVLYSYAWTDNSGRIQMLSYDVETGAERSYPEEYMLAGSEIMNIELSSLTNVFYIKIKTSDTRSRIYKYNIMNDFSFIMRADIGVKIAETKYSDNLIYQENTNAIQVRSGLNNSTSSLDFNANVTLLGIDSEDNIYTGELNTEGKVKSIFYGKVDSKPASSWKNIILDNPVLPEDINITQSGDIYSIDPANNFLFNVLQGKRIDFNGKFIEALDNGIAINNNGTLNLLLLKQ